MGWRDCCLRLSGPAASGAILRSRGSLELWKTPFENRHLGSRRNIDLRDLYLRPRTEWRIERTVAKRLGQNPDDQDRICLAGPRLGRMHAFPMRAASSHFPHHCAHGPADAGRGSRYDPHPKFVWCACKHTARYDGGTRERGRNPAGSNLLGTAPGTARDSFRRRA